MTRLALDTSAAVPLLVRNHPAHHALRRHVRGRSVVLTGHSLAETYSVLTRLPDGARVEPADAARLLDENFGPPILLEASVAAALPRVLAARGIRGGAVYDAMVALALDGIDVPLLTRDRRALATYATLGIPCEVAPE